MKEKTEKFKKILWQIGIIFGLCVAGELIAQLLPIAFPASVISMVLLFVLLLVKLIKPKYIEEAAGFLRDNMSFLFVPSTIGIMRYFETLKSVWLPFLVICIVSTVITFWVTASVVSLIMRLQNYIRRKRGTI